MKLQTRKEVMFPFVVCSAEWVDLSHIRVIVMQGYPKWVQMGLLLGAYFMTGSVLTFKYII